MMFFYLLTLILTTAVTAVILRFLIPYLKSRKLGQKILDIGPRWHKSKEGTPTMGGVMFIALVGGLVNLLVDILYAYIDPRLKSRYVGTKRTKKQLNQPEKEVAGDA